jgi:NAD(P)-dependent dehydrogenase (short-subunit alcohol dehydrogenase family)
MQRFRDKVVLVTGAGGGIGQASARRIAAEGGAVYCVDLNPAAVEAVVAVIRAEGGRASGRVCDISREDDVRACVAACVEEYGSLYALVNMAGLLRFDDTQQLTLAQWQQVIPHLLLSKGSIVNAASTAALSGLPCGVAYSASKGGVLAMTRSIAIEYAKRGVRANCVCPGEIKTGMTKGVAFPETMDFELISRVMSPSGARGPEAVAGVIAMLASEDGVHITGEDIRVDGGTLS